MVTKILYNKQRRGNLPFMLTWQSLDGRVQVQYVSNVREVKERITHLSSIGRQPTVFRRIDKLVERGSEV